MPKKTTTFQTSGRKGAATGARKRGTNKKTKQGGSRRATAQPPAQRKPLTITLHYVVCSSGDGGAYPRFFATNKQAEEAAEREDEPFTDAVGEQTFTIDPATGRILSGLDVSEADDEEADEETDQGSDHW